MFEFQNLIVYRKAKQFHQDIRVLTERPGLSNIVVNQLYRASFSIPLNIAEGSGRFSNADRKNFFVIARGSVFECVAVLDILKDNLIVDEDGYNELAQKADELSRILFKMIKNLSSR